MIPESIMISYGWTKVFVAFCGDLPGVIELLSFLTPVFISRYKKLRRTKNKSVSLKNDINNNMLSTHNRDTYVLRKVIKTVEKAIKVVVVILLLLVYIALFLILFVNVSNRFTHWFDYHDYGDMLYYGDAHGDKPHGYGRIFDKDENIVYIGDFYDGQPSGEGKQYDPKLSKETGTSFVIYEGGFKNNMYDGYGEEYALINGNRTLIYKGYHKTNQRTGYGEFFSYDSETGLLIETYDGSWFNNKRYGYGELMYFENENLGRKAPDDVRIHNQVVYMRYRGTFWDDIMKGYGIKEFYSENSEYADKWIYVANFKDNQSTMEGVLYSVDTREKIYDASYGVKDGREYFNILLADEDKTDATYPFPNVTMWDDS